MTDDLVKEEITCEEAFAILLRFNASHFRKTDSEHARYSIPANPQRDDDLRMHAFIKQSERLRAEVARLSKELEEAQVRSRLELQGALEALAIHVAEIERLTKERDEARQLVRWAAKQHADAMFTATVGRWDAEPK